MRILVTGSRGKVGSATVDALHQAGHDVTPATSAARSSRRRRPARPLRAGRPHRRRRRVRRRPRPRRGDPRRRAAGAEAQPAPHGLPQQPDERVQHARGRASAAACRATSTSRARPSPGFFFPERAVPARLRAGRRGAPDPPAGPVRDRQVLLRAADGRRHAPLGHPLPDHPPELGAVGGQLRARPRPRPARPRGRRRAPVWAYIDVYDLADALGSPPSPTSTPTRSSTSPRPTTTPTGRSPTSSATTTATTSSCASPSPPRRRRASASRRPSGCSATRRGARGATT